MNLKVNLGEDIDGNKLDVDLKDEGIRFILLAGSSGSGKSVFHYYLYKQLAEQNKPEDLSFVFFDMTRVDFADWKSPYISSYIADADKALKKFEELSKSEAQKTLVIHIEEMNMLSVSTTRFEDALEKILEGKRGNIYIVFSTSRPSVDVLTPKIRRLVDLKVVFNLSSSVDSKFMLGDDSATTSLINPGQRILVFGDKKISCKPFTAEETDEAGKYFWSK